MQACTRAGRHADVRDAGPTDRTPVVVPLRGLPQGAAADDPVVPPLPAAVRGQVHR